MGGIFISYRRTDSQGEAGRLFDDLAKHFGEDTVFMDVSAIEAGRDFRKAIEEGVTKCGVLLVVIGLEWLEAKDDHGARRLNDPSDFVRIETAAALKRDIPVIPVLVRGAKMPSADQLPEELKELAYRNCMELTHARWRSDIQLLTNALRRLLGLTPQQGTSARSSGPTAARQEATLADQDASSATFDPAALQRITKSLALLIGPIAEIVVKRAASHCNSLEDLHRKVAEEIDSPQDREKFLREASAAPSPALPKSAPPKSAPAPIPEMSTPPPSVAPDRSEPAVLFPRTHTPVSKVPSSNRQKYFLVGSVLVVVLILIVVYVARLASSKSPASSQSVASSASPTSPASSTSPPLPGSTTKAPASSPSQQIPSAKSDAPVTTAPLPPSNLTVQVDQPSPVAKKTEHASPKRVTVPPEVAKSLVISSPPPTYPLLARQAHVQGTVVLDANISKDGKVEALKMVSGHPLLVAAAIQAAQQWRYKPYLQNGEAVAIKTRILVDFTLR